jgi:hypothetical protein
MINGIKPIVSKPKPKVTKPLTNGLDFDDAMTNLLNKIQESYSGWGGNRMDRTLDLSLKKGRKFIKVVNDNSVWGFVALVDGEHKGVPMKRGDILKAATWSQPAKHSRGSIFDAEMHKSFSWTGPNYL